MRGGGRKDCKLGGSRVLKRSWKVGNLGRTDGLINIVCMPESIYVRTLDTYARVLLCTDLLMEIKQKKQTSTQPPPHHA